MTAGRIEHTVWKMDIANTTTLIDGNETRLEPRGNGGEGPSGCHARLVITGRWARICRRDLVQTFERLFHPPLRTTTPHRPTCGERVDFGFLRPAMFASSVPLVNWPSLRHPTPPSEDNSTHLAERRSQQKASSIKMQMNASSPCRRHS